MKFIGSILKILIVAIVLYATLQVVSLWKELHDAYTPEAYTPLNLLLLADLILHILVVFFGFRFVNVLQERVQELISGPDERSKPSHSYAQVPEDEPETRTPMHGRLSHEYKLRQLRRRRLKFGR